MKKSEPKQAIPIRDCRKLLRIMKLALVCLLLGTNMMWAELSYAQRTSLGLNLNNVELEKVFDAIRQQSEFEFFYNNDQVNTSVKVSVQLEDADITEVLNRVLPAIYEYKINDRYVLISKRKERKATLPDLLPQQTKRIIQGKVMDVHSEPVIGANIIEKGTTNGVVTDVNGMFSIEVSTPAVVLQISYIGYLNKEIPVGSNTVLTIILTEDIKTLDEVVVVGYGTMKKSDLTGSVVSIKMADKEMAANVNLSQALQGQAAGVNVSSTSRAGRSGSISIRGRTSFSASQNPLIVLDGIIYNGSLTDIDVSDIEKVDILKDASAAAVYGSRSANGVIIVTTKRGQSEKPTFNFNMYYGFQGMSTTPRTNVMNGDEYATRLVDYNYYLQELLPWYKTNPTSAAGRPARPDVTDRELVARSLRSQEERDNYLAGNEIDWIDEVYSVAPIQNYNLSVSGQTNRTNYYISGSYVQQDGIVKNDDFSRFTLRTNFDNKITDWFTVGLNIGMSRLDYSGHDKALNATDGERSRTNYALHYATIASPWANISDESGNYPLSLANESYQRHPLATQYIDNSNISNRLFTTVTAKIDIPFIQGLHYDFNFSNTNYNSNLNQFYPTTTWEGSGSNNLAQKVNAKSNEWLINNIVSYSRTFSDVHSVNGTLLYSAEKRTGEENTLTSSGFSNTQLGYDAVQFGETQSVSSNVWQETSLSYMARLNYAYDSKYMFTATYRRDGYSGFSKNNKYAGFPSVSAAWVISRENFMDATSNWLDHLKLRLSYGLNGNQGIGRYASLAKMSSTQYVFNGATAVGVYPSEMGNSDLSWEKTASFNFGLDVMVLKNRISAEIDIYTAKTSDVLVKRNIPQITSYSTVWSNLGGVKNKGVEIALNTGNIVKGDFRWDTKFMFSLNRNEITDIYGDGTKQDIANSWFVGEPIGTYYNYEVDGVWQEEDLFNGTIYPNYYPGMYKIVSQDETTTLNANKDRKIVGNNVPNYRFSINNNFSYKGFALSVFINSIQGGNGYYLGGARDLVSPGGSDYELRTNRTAINSYWRPDNPVNNATAMYYSSPLTPNIYKSKSFVRLQDISLSYSFPSSMLKTILLNNLQVYVSGKNLYTWTNWPGWDPEDDNAPLMRTVIFGLKMNF